MAKKHPRYWIALNYRGGALPSTCSYNRAGAMEKVLRLFADRWTWKKLYRDGWRLVRVELRVVSK